MHRHHRPLPWNIAVDRHHGRLPWAIRTRRRHLKTPWAVTMDDDHGSPKFGGKGPQFHKAVNGQSLTRPARLHNLDKANPKVVETRSHLAENHRKLVKASPNLTEANPKRADLEKHGPKLVETSPNLVETGKAWPHVIRRFQYQTKLPQTGQNGNRTKF